jgi:hypothetical protein
MPDDRERLAARVAFVVDAMFEALEDIVPNDEARALLTELGELIYDAQIECRRSIMTGRTAERYLAARCRLFGANEDEG